MVSDREDLGMSKHWSVRCKNPKCGTSIVDLEEYIPENPARTAEWENPAWKAIRTCPDCKQTHSYVASDLELANVPD